MQKKNDICPLAACLIDLSKNNYSKMNLTCSPTKIMPDLGESCSSRFSKVHSFSFFLQICKKRVTSKNNNNFYQFA